MDWGKLLTPVLRMFGRAAADAALRHGPELIAGKGKSRAEMTAAERRQAKAGRDLVKRARKAARLGRRVR